MKRFYKDVAIEAVDAQWRVTLDGRPIKTAGGRAQIVLTRKLAQALAAEWQAQGEELDPCLFVLRDLADYAIDIAAADRAEVTRVILAYAETDTLCYRGEAGEALNDRQQVIWEPYLTAAETRWQIRFERIDGVLHRPQPEETLARLKAVILSLDDFALAALHTLASLAASLVIGIAALEVDADPHALWDAANLEEDWQAELWGKDEEALELRAARFTTFTAAMRFAALARG